MDGAEVKVAIYNRYWITAGGGEKYSGWLARALADEHEVHLLGHEEIDREMLEERLGLDLSGIEARTIEDTGSGSLARATAGYDLLINSSFMGNAPSGARHGMYLVYFPTPFDHDLSPVNRAAARTLGPLFRSDAARLEWGTGFYLPEAARLRRFRWTSREAFLLVTAPEGTEVPVRLTLGSLRPPHVPPAQVAVELDGRLVSRAQVGPGRRPVRVAVPVTGRGEGDPAEIRIRSSTFVPKEAMGTHDDRSLGVALLSVQVERRLGAAIAARFPFLAAHPVSLDFLDSYDRVVAISQYAQEWVSRWWGRASDVLYPPVDPIPGGRKEPVVLSVGRFFDRRAGHSKKQLEMVRAFRRLVRRGLRGWEYHLVGGCSPQDASYLEGVKREARGLPIHIHVDAPGSVLRDLYSRASVFWHATGLGENLRRHPHRFEHFGISTVEAMSAGAVPVVFGGGGQLEVVEDAVNGRHFRTLDQLVDATWEIIEDEDLRRRLARAAAERARDFSPEHFVRRLHELVEETVRVP